MRISRRFAIRLAGSLTVLTAVIALPTIALACSCIAPVDTSRLAAGATAVFVGRVLDVQSPPIAPARPPITNADGTLTGILVPSSSATRVRLSVERSFKGANSPEIIIARDGGTCDYPFVTGSTYLVFARPGTSGFVADKCSRPLLLSRATESLKYLEGVQANRAQALLYGMALRQARDPGGNLVLQGTGEKFFIRAETPGRSFTVQANETDEFEMVLPPGDYRVWLELNGQTVSEPQSVRVSAEDSRPRTLAAFPKP
jgi:hypothetical protein